MTIFDLSGDTDYDAAVADYCSNLQIVLLCYNVNDKSSLDVAEQWLGRIQPKSALKDMVVMVVGCKKDLCKASVVTDISEETRCF